MPRAIVNPNDPRVGTKLTFERRLNMAVAVYKRMFGEVKPSVRQRLSKDLQKKMAWEVSATPKPKFVEQEYTFINTDQPIDVTINRIGSTVMIACNDDTNTNVFLLPTRQIVF